MKDNILRGKNGIYPTESNTYSSFCILDRSRKSKTTLCNFVCIKYRIPLRQLKVRISIWLILLNSGRFLKIRRSERNRPEVCRICQRSIISRRRINRNDVKFHLDREYILEYFKYFKYSKFRYK